MGYISLRQNIYKNDSSKRLALFYTNLEIMKTDIFYINLLSGILSVCNEHGYELILRCTGESDYTLNHLVNEHREDYDCMIIHKPLETVTEIPDIPPDVIPYVMIGRPKINQGMINYVDTDNIAISYHAVKHLLELNHKRIILLNGTDSDSFAEDRLAGYRQALMEYSVEWDPALIFNCGLFFEDSKKIILELIKNKVYFTGVVACGDNAAVGSVNALQEAGLRIPQDVSVVCAGETILTVNNMIPITGIDINGVETGRAAVNLVLDILEKRVITKTHFLTPFTVNVRSSTGKTALYNREQM